MSAPSPFGRLLLVPNTLDLGCEPQDLRQAIPDAVLAQAASIRHWVVEDAKSARAFLKRVGGLHPLAAPLQELNICELPRVQKGGGSHGKGGGHAAGGGRGGAGNAASPSGAGCTAPSIDALLEPALAGQDIGLLSEAGLPAVADPGSEVVATAHRRGVPVLPLSGPNSLMLALAASGLQGQCFAFVGYLPQVATARAQRLRELEARSRREHQTQLCIETPYRNAALMDAMIQTLQPATRLSVACGLTLPTGWCRTRTVQQWRAERPSFDKGLPAVFSFLA